MKCVITFSFSSAASARRASDHLPVLADVAIG
jgi:endonuclease/exonuclease/phosphatase family metal-dependent hydrolase